MRTVADIVLGITGQTVTCDATEGRPSSVTSVEVFSWHAADTGSAETAATSGTVETNPNTTLDGAAGVSQADPRNVPLTATTGIAVDRLYLITSATGLREWIEVADITSADSVRARHPLHNDYASGATFQSTRMTATIDASWVADTANLDAASGPGPMYRVRWTYVVASVTYVQDTYFNLVRYAGRHGVFPQDVDAVMPGWLDRLPTDHRVDQGARLIDKAHRDVVLDLYSLDLDDSMIAESEVIDELVRFKAAGDDKAYTIRRDDLVRIVNRVPVRDVAGAAAPKQSIGLTRR